MVRRPRPDKRDVFIGNFEPYGFHDIHDETADETLRVWTEDSLTRESYLGGLAHLYQHRGAEAATDFQKLLDHRGLVLNYHYGALANLALARAYALQGETAKARAKNQDFLALWKDADADIPVLKQAKAEFAKVE